MPHLVACSIRKRPPSTRLQVAAAGTSLPIGPARNQFLHQQQATEMNPEAPKITRRTMLGRTADAGAAALAAGSLASMHAAEPPSEDAKPLVWDMHGHSFRSDRNSPGAHLPTA